MESGFSHRIQGPPGNSGLNELQKVSGPNSCSSKDRGVTRIAFSQHYVDRPWKLAKDKGSTTSMLKLLNCPHGEHVCPCIQSGLPLFNLLSLSLTLPPRTSMKRMALCIHKLLDCSGGLWSLLRSSHHQTEQALDLQPLPTGWVLQPWPHWGPSTERVPIHCCPSYIKAPKLAVVIQVWSKKFSSLANLRICYKFITFVGIFYSICFYYLTISV